MDKTLETIVKLNHLFWSPNLVWLAIAVAVHVFTPYDFEAAKEGFAADWLIKRFLLNYAVAFVYYGFFFAGLYVFELSGRKYVFLTLTNRVFANTPSVFLPATCVPCTHVYTLTCARAHTHTHTLHS